MHNFKILNLNDQKSINNLLKGSFYYEEYTSSELVFENLYVWNYCNQIELLWIEEGIAIIRCLEKDKFWIYFPPVCKTRSEFIRGLNFIRENYPNNLVVGLSQKMIETCNDNKFLILYDDYYSEYIYNPCELAEMKGGKFSRKRNLISQFKKKYQHEFISFSNSYLESVKEFLNRYQDEGGADEDFDAIIFALENEKSLNLFCDLLMVDEAIVGLSIGAISVFNHGVILFEKNDYNYVGSGAILVQLTTQKHYSNLSYLTRQEDLGLPQLRKAKLALNPLVKERKYSCVFNPDAIDLYNLYKKSFDDSSDYVDFFFLHSYNSQHAYFVKRDDKIVSALHIIMKKMMYRNQVFDLPFVVAASTDNDYRRKGLMREVMSKTFADLKDKGYWLVSLYPVNPAFYLDYGFVHFSYGLKLEKLESTFQCGLEQTNDSDMLSKMYNHCIEDQDGFIIRDESYYNQYLNSLWQDGVVFDLIKKDGETLGYVAHNDGDIDEILLCSEQRPIHDDIDFSQAVMPHHIGDIPSNMIRIINIKKLLESITVEKNIAVNISVRITDHFVEDNNVIVNISSRNGLLAVEPSDSYELSISIEDLTKVLFLGQGDSRLAFLFPKKKMVCFDKF